MRLVGAEAVRERCQGEMDNRARTRHTRTRSSSTTHSGRTVGLGREFPKENVHVLTGQRLVPQAQFAQSDDGVGAHLAGGGMGGVWVVAPGAIWILN